MIEEETVSFERAIPLVILAIFLLVSIAFTIGLSFPETEACLTLDKLNQAVRQNALLPSDLGGKIVVTAFEEKVRKSIFVISLNTGDIQNIGEGIWPSLSHDGSRLAYSYAERLRIINFAAGENITPGMRGYNIHWSLDDTRLIYQSTDSSYVVNADGSGLQIIDVGPDKVSLAGWLTDNKTIVYATLSETGVTFISYNLYDGERNNLFIVNSFDIKDLFGEISSDGRWILHYEPVLGEERALFISRLDGSSRRLILNTNEVNASFGAISPNGQWLILNTKQPEGHSFDTHLGEHDNVSNSAVKYCCSQ